MDETSPQTTSNTAKVWSEEKPVRIKNTEKIRCNTFGFYALNGTSVSHFPKRSRKEEVCEFLDKVRSENGSRTVVMILDNCPSHKADVVKERADLLDIRLLYLPPYSPQFNPIETIWRSVKRRISRSFILCREHMTAIVEESFVEESAKGSYAAAWKETFLSNIILNC